MLPKLTIRSIWRHRGREAFWAELAVTFCGAGVRTGAAAARMEGARLAGKRPTKRASQIAHQSGEGKHFVPRTSAQKLPSLPGVAFCFPNSIWEAFEDARLPDRIPIIRVTNRAIRVVAALPVGPGD